MTNKGLSAMLGVIDGLDGRASRVIESSRDGNMVGRLGGADWLSLAALFCAWVGGVLFLRGEPNWAILAVLGGFVFDKLDGFYARTTGSVSRFGRGIDSFIDVFVYVVSAALLYHFTMAPHPVVSVVVGFVLLMFGGLRLVRHTTEGFGSDGDESYYVGTTVVHTHVVVLANYYLITLVDPWNGWLAGLTVVAVCPLMTSRYRAYKTDVGHWLVAGVGSVAVALSLAIEFGAV
ncbi:CDP-alcohol phosphatidyltransferase family protein [Haloplanus pelagicus]|jgi:CDP-diacylglycerol--serine O-phosphatidyltransferase|uniref:CDP-alcohol phosphatidyltransferase family protein n=1 Tax=Haloplanus pelagicus TaxID=2949995 RepID=UPI00203FC1EA|nr:CDP-alcohol phosphatidyltransferase family protein [Haloplanus sp. HW8-1]